MVDPAPGGALYAVTEHGLFKWVPENNARAAELTAGETDRRRESRSERGVR